MKNCRVLLTKQCNLNCSYCIMKDKEVAETFKPITYDAFIKKISDYESFGLTGGEPTICTFFLAKMISTIRGNSDKPIYLYTNGSFLDKVPEYALKDLNGINLGIHGNIDWDLIDRMRHLVPVRIHIHVDELNDDIKVRCQELGVEIKEFEYGQCDTVEEDRWFVSY